VTNVNASAPGKAVLSGEYAVLYGAPAIVTALDRRARVTLRSSDQEFHTVTAPGYLEGTWRFLQDRHGNINWHDELPARSAFLLLENIWKQVSLGPTLRLSVDIDSREFFAATSGAKLGLGSSAAVATALTSALCDISAVPTEPADVFRIAKDAHIAFQGGRGSGVDIAASFYGGLINFRSGAQGSLSPLAWPGGLVCRFLWSGRPAITTTKLQKLEAAVQSSETAQSLVSAAEDIALTWSAASVERIMASMGHYVEVLQQFDVDHDLGIFDAGHGALVEMAAGNDIVYKPCGAGGGDIGVVFATNEESASDFCAAAKAQQFVLLDLEPGTQGAQTVSGKEFE